MNVKYGPYVKAIAIVSTVFFSIFIVLGIGNIVGVVMLICYYKYWCRYIIYVIFVVLFLLGLVCFLLSILLSILTPFVYFTCDFISVSISSPDNFSTNLVSVFDSQLINSIKVCLPGGNGNIIDAIGVDMSSVDFVINLMTNIRDFNAPILQN
jgi:hypothetical protein